MHKSGDGKWWGNCGCPTKCKCLRDYDDPDRTQEGWIAYLAEARRKARSIWADYRLG